MKIRIQLDKDWRYSLAFQCPSCGNWDETAVQTAFTGEEFVCDCGEDIPISREALSHLRQELEAIRALTTKVVEVPV